MKVSIITLHGANNVGAFLQAFSLQTVVESLEGVEKVNFIRFPAHQEKKSKLQKVFYYLRKRKIRSLLFKYKTAKKYNKVMDSLHVDEKIFSKGRKYDTIIVGSDEVWNLASNNFIHHQQYFAKEISARNICSYAASANNTESSIVFLNKMDIFS